MNDTVSQQHTGLNAVWGILGLLISLGFLFFIVWLIARAWRAGSR